MSEDRLRVAAAYVTVGDTTRLHHLIPLRNGTLDDLLGEFNYIVRGTNASAHQIAGAIIYVEGTKDEKIALFRKRDPLKASRGENTPVGGGVQYFDSGNNPRFAGLSTQEGFILTWLEELVQEFGGLRDERSVTSIVDLLNSTENLQGRFSAQGRVLYLNDQPLLKAYEENGKPEVLTEILPAALKSATYDTFKGVPVVIQLGRDGDDHNPRYLLTVNFRYHLTDRQIGDIPSTNEYINGQYSSLEIIDLRTELGATYSTTPTTMGAVLIDFNRIVKGDSKPIFLQNASVHPESSIAQLAQMRHLYAAPRIDHSQDYLEDILSRAGFEERHFSVIGAAVLRLAEKTRVDGESVTFERHRDQTHTDRVGYIHFKDPAGDDVQTDFVFKVDTRADRARKEIILAKARKAHPKMQCYAPEPITDIPIRVNEDHSLTIWKYVQHQEIHDPHKRKAMRDLSKVLKKSAHLLVNDWVMHGIYLNVLDHTYLKQFVGDPLINASCLPDFLDFEFLKQGLFSSDTVYREFGSIVERLVTPYVIAVEQLRDPAWGSLVTHSHGDTKAENYFGAGLVRGDYEGSGDGTPFRDNVRTMIERPAIFSRKSKVSFGEYVAAYIYLREREEQINGGSFSTGNREDFINLHLAAAFTDTLRVANHRVRQGAPLGPYMEMAKSIAAGLV